MAVSLQDVSYVHQIAVPHDLCSASDGGEHYYLVMGPDGKTLGYTWREEVFTYMGTEGWNRGVRIRDYYPKEWKAACEYGEFTKLSYKTRKEAVKRFLESLG